MMQPTAIAMSGGVDSTMAAYFIKEQGRPVVGMHFITGYEDDLPPEHEDEEAKKEEEKVKEEDVDKDNVAKKENEDSKDDIKEKTDTDETKDFGLESLKHECR